MKKINKQGGLALSSSKGFTLIEILVVIGIIAILATIVLIAINPARQFAKARDTQRTSNVNAILNAVGQFVADKKGTLPTVPVKGAAAVEIGVALCNELVPTYMPSLPTNPGSSKKGTAITTCAQAVAGAVLYNVAQDNAGRITISTPIFPATGSAESDQDDDGDVDANDIISVTR